MAETPVPQPRWISFKVSGAYTESYIAYVGVLAVSVMRNRDGTWNASVRGSTGLTDRAPYTSKESAQQAAISLAQRVLEETADALTHLRHGSPSSRYAMLERVGVVRRFSAEITSFLHWLGDRGYLIASRHRHTDDCRGYPGEVDDVGPRCGYTEGQLEFVSRSSDSLIADFYEIDQEQVEAERTALLSSLGTGGKP